MRSSIRTTGRPEGRWRSLCWRDDDGVTLVELMVTMLILGVLLAATASSLITFSRASAVNERRVQATAYLNELHESLQTIPWDRAAVYDDEIAALDGAGGASGATPPTFDGRPMVLLDAPDNTSCPVDEPDCAKLPLVPEVAFDQEIEGRDYSVLQAVTWVDRNGDGTGDVKRFTTVVSWEVLGRTYTQSFESDRAPTAGEVAVVSPPEVVQFAVTPDAAAIAADGALLDALTITARFDRGITSAEVSYLALEAGVLVGRSMTLAPTLFESAKPVAFRGMIPAGSQFFDEGATSFELTGFDAVTPITATTSVDMLPPAATPPGSTPVVTSVIPLRSNVNVGNSGANSGKLRCALTVEARVDDLDAAGTVTLAYTAITAEGITMTPPGAITGSNDLFTWTFASGSTSLWQPPASGLIQEAFAVIARTSDGRSSSAELSSTVVFNSNNGGC